LTNKGFIGYTYSICKTENIIYKRNDKLQYLKSVRQRELSSGARKTDFLREFTALSGAAENSSRP